MLTATFGPILTGRYSEAIHRKRESSLAAEPPPETAPCLRPVALNQHAQEIYVAHAVIADESGFSQADLADLLEQTKKQVADLERIHGTITPNGLTLHCVGKGGKASCRLLLNPDQSGNLKTILHHSVEDFRLELPGPSWLVGLLVSRDAIETSIRTGLRDLAREIDERLRRHAIALFTNQIQTTETALHALLADRATLTLARLRYPVWRGTEDQTAVIRRPTRARRRWMHDEREARAAPGSSPLQHLLVAVGIAEGHHGAAADVGLNADRFPPCRQRN